MPKYIKKIKALSLFSNVGISETYLEEIGVDVVIANELLEERAQFYRHLYPKTDMICGDITSPKIFAKVRDRAKEENVNMIIATPPCQGMSCAGSKNPDDPRNFLIYYAIEMIKEVQPDLIILENVPMQMHTKIEYQNEKVLIPDYIEAELGDYYNFNNNRVVNAMDYGVPQSRQRYIYLMTKKSLDINWEFPKPTGTILTLRDVLYDLPSLDPELREKDERWRFPDFEKKKKAGQEVSKWHVPPVHSWKQVEWLIHTPSGCSAFKNDIYFPCKDGRRIKGAPRTYMRMFWDKPATTVMQNSGVISTFSTVHPGRMVCDGTEEERYYSDARTLTIYELLIVSSLPLDWKIPDWAGDTLIRKVIGEGIPPLLIKTALKQIL